MARPRKNMSSETMDLMEEISEDEINEFFTNNEEDLIRSLDIDFDMVD